MTPYLLLHFFDSPCRTDCALPVQVGHTPQQMLKFSRTKNLGL